MPDKKCRYMKIEKAVAKKLVRDGIISVFLYALPVLLMFLWFYLKGERPWTKQPKETPVQVTR